jgi:hypothetical protein
MGQSQLLAGISVAEITPPLEVGLLTSAVNGLYEPFKSVRLPLKARVLVLKSQSEQIAVVSLDLLSLTDTSVGGWEEFKQGMADVIPADRIILCYIHTHTAPESGAISDLYLTKLHKNWLSQVQLKIKRSINEALQKARPCSVSFATSILNDYSLQRRIKTPAGIIMSDSVQPVSEELMQKGPVDHRVSSIYFNDDHGAGIATVVHAVCHPVHEMCMPHISPDFPGEMCIALDTSGKNGMGMFLNGAAGNTNPPTVSMGPKYAHQHGVALARLAMQHMNQSRLDTSLFSFLCTEVQMKIRSDSGVINQLDALARLSAVRIGSMAILFLPGEPFIEVAFEIEKSSPFVKTILVGYGENNIGYLPTEAAFNEGGYEIGPGKWSFLEKGADKIIGKKGIQLLEELYNR